MDYIKREDALSDAMCEGISCQECPFLIHPVNGGCKIENYIKSIPAADIVERKRGMWIQDGFCSECGSHAPYWNIATPYPINFCPNCGADMREE